MSQSEAAAQTTQFECVTPIVPVANLQASIEYYVNVLGFRIDWHGGPMASVSRGGCHIMLCEGEQGHPGTWVWIGVGDADLLFAEYRVKGAKIRRPPTNYSWAYELQVFDLDSNVLRLGSDTREGEPFGPWLDEKGVLWRQSADGGWERAEPATSG
ncbi:MAG TPA: VOC family protein [Candidatus Binatia bacterium]|nr:VOC family protein [Candidatus Binatia bacterium]